MVDNPEKLCAICLQKFASLLKCDEFNWKKQIEECIDQIYRTDNNQLTLNDQRKRKYPRTDEDNISQIIDYNAYEVKFVFRIETLVFVTIFFFRKNSNLIVDFLSSNNFFVDFVHLILYYPNVLLII